MKPLVFLIFGVLTYLVIDIILKKSRFKKNKLRKLLLPFVIVCTSSLFVLGLALSYNQADIQCGKSHEVTYSPPVKIQTAKDYFNLGNYQYDSGNCNEAVTSFGKAIEINPKYAEAYDNRAYTYMRMRMFENALKDLDKAIEIRPDYVNALMNRGDIYNFNLINRNKAIHDYDKVLAIVKDTRERRGLSVCGHRLIAEDGGWSPKIYVQFITQGFDVGCK